MVNINRVTATWTGLRGLPGYSNFYFLTTAGIAEAVSDLFTNMSNLLPAGLSIDVPHEGDTIDSVTGDLVGSWVYPGASQAVVSGAALHAAPVGAVINWKTDGLRNAHRIKGRTFMVPLSSDTFEADGSLAPDKRAVIQASADALIASMAPNFVIWSRPVLGAGGATGGVLTAFVPDIAAVLRSRRD